MGSFVLLVRSPSGMAFKFSLERAPQLLAIESSRIPQVLQVTTTSFRVFICAMFCCFAAVWSTSDVHLPVLAHISMLGSFLLRLPQLLANSLGLLLCSSFPLAQNCVSFLLLGLPFPVLLLLLPLSPPASRSPNLSVPLSSFRFCAIRALPRSRHRPTIRSVRPAGAIASGGRHFCCVAPKMCANGTNSSHRMPAGTSFANNSPWDHLSESVRTLLGDLFSILRRYAPRMLPVRTVALLLGVAVAHVRSSDAQAASTKETRAAVLGLGEWAYLGPTIN